MKAVKYIVIYFIAIQLLLPVSVSLAHVYRNRIDYELVKNNVHDIDAVLQQIKREIDREGQTGYVIMLGDSVFWGSPGSSDQSVSAHLERKPGAPVIYNLSMPAMQLGDMYTMLLKLDEYGIATDRLLFNIRYASFIPREPGPRAVFWLAEDLRRLDPEAFARILPQLKSAGYKEPSGPYQAFRQSLHEDWLPRLPLVRYKDYIRKELHHLWLKARNKPIPDDALDDSRPWHVKKRERGADYDKVLEDPFLIQSFTDRPFDLSEQNPDVYFLHKILRHQAGKRTLVALTGTNHELMRNYVEKPGYKANLEAIDRHFSGMPVTYVNLEGVISDDLFTDHTHYTPEGNAMLADLLWERLP